MSFFTESSIHEYLRWELRFFNHIPIGLIIRIFRREISENVLLEA